MNTSKNAKKFITLLVVSLLLVGKLSANILSGFYAKLQFESIRRGLTINSLIESISIIIYFVVAIIICFIPCFLKRNSTNSSPELPVKKACNLNTWYSYFCVYYTMMWIGNLITTLIESIEKPEVLADYLLGYYTGLKGLTDAISSSTSYMQEEGWRVILFSAILTPLLINIVYRKMIMDRLFKYSAGVAVLVPGIVIALMTLYSFNITDWRYLNWQLAIDLLGVLGGMIVSVYLAYIYLCTRKAFMIISLQATAVLIQVLNETYWGVNLWVQMDELTGYLIAWGINAIWGIAEIMLLINGICGIILARTEMKNIITKDDRKIVFRNFIYIVAIVFILYN